MVHSSRPLYGASLALLTDLYELTMAYGYWKAGMADWWATFHVTFRKNPFHGSYAVACGLHSVIDFVESLHFSEDDLEYLASLRGHDGTPLFDDDGFLDYLSRLTFQGDLDAVPEGTVICANEPLVRVCAPLPQAQILETALLTLLNFQTLIATKAARVSLAADGDPVLEFGLRRAQGIDGGVSEARAAYVGGCFGTSNVLAGKLFGIPVRGTVAHSWIMAFDDELEAFRRYAEAMPNNVILLVDTYDTLTGVRHAIEIGRQLRARGQRLIGIRLDSGDLAELSKQARRMLDEAGLTDVAIVASSELDEYAIAELKRKGAPIQIWGVGTKLAVAYDQPALGGVYKLAAVRRPGGQWEPRIKLSEEPIKISHPGRIQVRRYARDGRWAVDVLYDVSEPEPSRPVVDFYHPGRTIDLAGLQDCGELLVPVFRGGKLVYERPALPEIQQRCREQLRRLPEAVRRFAAPEPYPLGVSARMQRTKEECIRRARARLRQP